MENERKEYIYLHLGVLIAGGTGIFGRLISLNELPLVWYRMSIGAIVFAIMLHFMKKLRLPAARQLMPICGCGILLAIHWMLFYSSIKASNVSIAVVCIALNGFFTAIIEPLINRHRISWRELLLSLLTVAGIMLIFGFDARYRLGIALGTVSSLAYVLFSICSKEVAARTKQNSSTMLLYELAAGAALLTLAIPVYMQFSPGLRILPMEHEWWQIPVFATIFTIGPFFLTLHALRTISAFIVNLSFNLEPLYSILFAMALFNEARELNFAFWIGVTLIVFSVITPALTKQIK